MLWIIYLINDQDTLAWVAFALLVVVAVLGFTMLVRWLPSYRVRARVTASGAGAGRAAPEAVEQPAEQHFPVAVVGAHGVLAVITVVTVLLAALGVGGS